MQRFLLLLPLLLAGCDGLVDSMMGAEDPALVPGTYELVSVNDASLPIVEGQDGPATSYLEGVTMVLRADNTGSIQFRGRSEGPDGVYRYTDDHQATWEVDIEQIDVRWADGSGWDFVRDDTTGDLTTLFGDTYKFRRVD